MPWTSLITVAPGFFNDNGAANSPVNLVGALQPSAVIVGGTQPYEFSTSAAGKISGGATLTMNNTSTLTLDTYNDYTGPTVINSGTVQVGDGTTLGTSIGTGPVTNNSALVFAQPDTNSVISISGTGKLTLVGGGKTIVTGNATQYRFDLGGQQQHLGVWQRQCEPYSADGFHRDQQRHGRL